MSVEKEDTSERSFAQRWKHQALFDKGFLAIPSHFLRYHAQLKPYPLTVGEALFVIHLMSFKWDAKDPFPSYRLLAERMGISDKLARRHARSLEIKKYLNRKARVAKTNQFDLSPLFDALLHAVERDKASSVN